MKVIFLDVDGVIAIPKTGWCVPSEQWHDDFGYPADKGCISRLNKIIEQTGAEIVFSSSWRLQYKSKEGREKLFNHWGVIKAPIDHTILLGNGLSCRGEEIQRWLDQCDNTIDRYVILDDDSDMLDEQKQYFINTDAIDGLTDSDVERAIEILNL